MRVLVTWGSERGGTAGIGRVLSDALGSHGFEVVAVPAREVEGLGTFGAVIVGGALYANCWPRDVRRFVNRHVAPLRKVPVWFFSSGPLDDSADRKDILPTRQVAVLAERIGVKGHVTFGGRLERNATGFPASAMAKKRSGDWRNPDRIQAWAATLATELPTATPGTPIDHLARSLPRLMVHGIAGWALCAATMAVLLPLVSLTVAFIAHGVAAPVFFSAIAWSYFRARGARDPLPTALAWTAIVMLLDLVVVAGVIQRSLAMFERVHLAALPPDPPGLLDDWHRDVDDARRSRSLNLAEAFGQTPVVVQQRRRRRLVDIRRAAAIGYAVISAGVVAFQVVLAGGVPWGSYAMGGAFPGRFPPVMRVVALAQAVLIVLMTLVVLSRAGLTLPSWSRASRRLVWLVVALGVVSFVLNIATPSADERMIWAPATFLLLACGVLVATGKAAP